MTDLDHRARELVDAARTESGLDAEARAEGRARLRTSLAAAGLAAAAVTAGTRTAIASGWSLAAKGAAGVSVILAGGVLYALTASHRDAPERAPSAPAALNPPEAPPAPAPVAGPAPSGESVVSKAHRQTHPTPSAPSAPSATSARPDVATSMAADVKLLRDVRAALAAGQPDVALALLQVRRKDPDPGGLAPEREAARLVTLCRLGRGEEARRGVQSFLRTHPGSPLNARIKEECP